MEAFDWTILDWKSFTWTTLDWKLSIAYQLLKTSLLGAIRNSIRVSLSNSESGGVKHQDALDNRDCRFFSVNEIFSRNFFLIETLSLAPSKIEANEGFREGANPN